MLSDNNAFLRLDLVIAVTFSEIAVSNIEPPDIIAELVVLAVAVYCGLLRVAVLHLRELLLDTEVKGLLKLLFHLIGKLVFEIGYGSVESDSEGAGAVQRCRLHF